MHRDHIAIKVMKRFLELLLFIYVIAIPPGLGPYQGSLCQAENLFPFLKNLELNYFWK